MGKGIGNGNGNGKWAWPQNMVVYANELSVVRKQIIEKLSPNLRLAMQTKTNKPMEGAALPYPIAYPCPRPCPCCCCCPATPTPWQGLGLGLGQVLSPGPAAISRNHESHANETATAKGDKTNKRAGVGVYREKKYVTPTLENLTFF